MQVSEVFVSFPLLLARKNVCVPGFPEYPAFLYSLCPATRDTTRDEKPQQASTCFFWWLSVELWSGCGHPQPRSHGQRWGEGTLPHSPLCHPDKPQPLHFAHRWVLHSGREGMGWDGKVGEGEKNGNLKWMCHWGEITLFVYDTFWVYGVKGGNGSICHSHP